MHSVYKLLFTIKNEKNTVVQHMQGINWTQLNKQ